MSEQDRLDKLEKIKALGIDPWGSAFPGKQDTADIFAIPTTATAEPRPVLPGTVGEASIGNNVVIAGETYKIYSPSYIPNHIAAKNGNLTYHLHLDCKCTRPLECDGST